jgi:hypothetical protein
MKTCTKFSRRLGGASLVVVLLVLASVPVAACGQEGQANEKQRRIKALIESLASPNKPPPDDRKGGYRIPPDYDRRAQQRIHDVCKAIVKEGFDAFPELVSHADDRRYCCTMEGMSSQENFSVGEMCWHLLEHQIAVYDNDLQWLGRFRPGCLPGRESLAKWWEKRKGFTLLQLQIEATENVLEQTKRVSTETLRRFRDAGVDVDIQKAKNVAQLEELLTRLKAADAPIRTTGICSRAWRMTGLPK